MYRDLVKSVSNGDLSIDFRTLRFSCLGARNCDPRGENRVFIAIREAMRAKEYEGAAKAAEQLIANGFPNIQAHAACSEAYTALGNSEKAKFHHDVTSALIRSILDSGDGKTKETAFEVIGTFEEYTTMSVLGFPRPSAQSLIPGKPHSYDYLEVVDPKSGAKTGVYFRIDAFYPMKGLRN